LYQQYNNISIEFSNQNNDTFVLEFVPRLENNITHRWIEVLNLANKLYQIDDPNRFYDFKNLEHETDNALKKINKDIEIINNYHNLIDRKLNTIEDQETLNYLHNIFEVYHGHLQKQNETDFFKNAPSIVQKALADLNIDVHRCEHIARTKSLYPRFVATWYGLPKTHHYFDQDYELFTNNYKFGTIYLCYCEIGKNLYDMWKDDELGDISHATEDAFKPFDYFSADIHVKFYDSDPNEAKNEEIEMYNYYKKHKDYFIKRGYAIDDIRLNIGMLPVADLKTSLSKQQVIDKLSEFQNIKSIKPVESSTLDAFVWG